MPFTIDAQLEQEQQAIFATGDLLNKHAAIAEKNGWTGIAQTLERHAREIKALHERQTDKNRENYLVNKKEWRDAEKEPGGRREPNNPKIK